MSGAKRKEEPATIVDDWVEDLLDGWSGLRLYLRDRRAGRPADETMDVLLRELLRVRLAPDANIPDVVRQITAV